MLLNLLKKIFNSLRENLIKEKIKKNFKNKEIKFLKKHYNNKKELVFFEVGANNFSDAIRFKKYFPEVRVYAFEPDRDNLKMFSQNAINQGVIVESVALSDENSETVFYSSDSLNGVPWKLSGSLIKPKLKPGTTEAVNQKGLFFNFKGYDVQVVRLDTFCEQNKILKIDYLHIDVQGAEHKVISGLGILRPPFIYAETCEYDAYETGYTLEMFDQLMNDKGYKIEKRFEYDTLYKFNGF
jgi:FkbM family methyltransferase